MAGSVIACSFWAGWTPTGIPSGKHLENPVQEGTIFWIPSNKQEFEQLLLQSVLVLSANASLPTAFWSFLAFRKETVWRRRSKVVSSLTATGLRWCVINWADLSWPLLASLGLSWPTWPLPVSSWQAAVKEFGSTWDKRKPVPAGLAKDIGQEFGGFRMRCIATLLMFLQSLSERPLGLYPVIGIWKPGATVVRVKLVFFLSFQKPVTELCIIDFGCPEERGCFDFGQVFQQSSIIDLVTRSSNSWKELKLWRTCNLLLLCTTEGIFKISSCPYFSIPPLHSIDVGTATNTQSGRRVQSEHVVIFNIFYSSVIYGGWRPRWHYQGRDSYG